MIRKGEPWGEEVDTPVDLVAAASDAQLAGLLAAMLGETHRASLTVTAGDLHRTLGRPNVVGSHRARRVPLDVLHCELDGVAHLAVAHVVARGGGRRGWWRGPIRAVFNVEHLGSWDVAPSGHPNDGRAEVLEVDAAMSVRQRHQAWRRLPSGGHVPHPLIRSAHRDRAEWRLPDGLDVYVDGVRHRRVRDVRVTVEADAFELYV